jgi:hypothetical protein
MENGENANVTKKTVKTKLYQVRLTEEDADLFESISEETDDTRAEVFRKALKLYATIKRNNAGNFFL